MLGLTALAYALVHFTLYVADQKFDLARVASEIVFRIYLTIGFVGLLGLVVLGVTSTDGMIRRLGKAWPRLHRLVYRAHGAGAAALLHPVEDRRLEPGLLERAVLALMGWRLMHHLKVPTAPLPLLGLSVAAGLATAGLEALWYALATNVPAARCCPPTSTSPTTCARPGGCSAR